MNAVAVIPARLQSTRLPRKVLADIHGKPLIWHVWQRVTQADGFSAVYIATDADEVYDAALEWGANVIMTSPDYQSGTERIAACLPQLGNVDMVVNVQGDEPLIDPAMLTALIARWNETKADLITPVYAIETLEDLRTPNIVKVARTAKGEALYFSRSPIPHVRDIPMEAWLDECTFWGHVGVYGYRRDVLAAYPDLPISDLELTEKLEQLRFLAAGYRFQTIETTYHPVAVDVPDDLERVRQMMASK